MDKLRQTPSQTVGPFFAYGLTARQYGYDFTSIVDNSLVGAFPMGIEIDIIGHVFDGEGKPIPDALIEFRQADEKGRYRSVPLEKADSDFRGFGRFGTGTEPDAGFHFITVKPKALSGQAPHINVILFMRGSLRHLYTRIYFPDELNIDDPILRSVDPSRIRTLIAESSGANRYQFDIHMQGLNETVFFDL
ncbi:protocatechuate 3,4-dioxygenase alpha subunit [Chryseolinea serpens]|uniref:Protocatechuate 3,4-dioxygenase alpha subunit n=1 Tax=Chryseolinea serpens TaxID=947013 RepID=A0A1M5TD91_9BACT|nr:protocatechuate 3,4-dioxygenase subunit alpha [Chryseolinea serpens]SHH48689.1 protocatechuate 3,4-dioxygenase alpha subunit [Chryseolinea serpens]